MKKRLHSPLVLLLALFVMTLVFTGFTSTTSAQVQFVVVSSGSPGGVYFPLGAGIAKVITDRIDGVFAQSETTGASVENSRLVGSGESEMGMAMANVAFDAYRGDGAFENDAQPIKAMFSMYPAAQHLIVPADSDIYTIYDLAGKTVSVDAPGSGCEVTSYIILEAAGILDEVNTVNYSQPEAADAIKDRLVDAVFYNFAYPGAVVEEIMFARSIRFIPLSDAVFENILAEYPYFTKGSIPEGVYQLEEDVAALMVGNLMVVHEDMDDDLVYNILEAIFHENSINELIGIHPIARLFQPELAKETGLPLHPGAERFFQQF